MTEYTNEEKEKMAQEKLMKMLDELDGTNLPPANIIVSGITGTGKSTLINAVFGAELASTGKGRPVTSNIQEYQDDDIPIRIWDTVGLELDSQKTKMSIASIKETISRKADNENVFDRIHAIWYCINSASHRYQGTELEFIKDLHSTGVPFIIVLTQCIDDPSEIDNFESQIRDINKSMGINDIDVVQVCAMDYKIRGLDTVKAFGLDKLVDATLDRLPDFLQESFLAAQRVSKEQKRKQCEVIINEYVDKAQTGWYNNMPIANIFTASHSITQMLVRIARLYNTKIKEEDLNKIIKEVGTVDIPNGFFGFIVPNIINGKYKKKLDSLFEEKKKDGFNIQDEKLSQEKRVARIVVYYGYTFLDVLEQLWQECSEAELNNIKKLIEKLRSAFNDKLQEKHGN